MYPSQLPTVKQKARDRVNKWRIKQFKENPNFQAEENARGRRNNAERRTRCLNHYSNVTMSCVCCGESEILFLELDHVKGDGRKHRKSLNITKLHNWLITNDYPEGFQVLCCNCNKGKYLNSGQCPHVSD